MKRKDITKYDIDCYDTFLQKIIVDKKILDEILTEVDSFYKDGCVVIEGNNFSGRKSSKNGSDYLKISYENNTFICHYTKYNSKFVFNIIQTFFNNHIKIDKYENVRCKCAGNHSEDRVVEYHWIYDEEKRLLFESIFNEVKDYDVSNFQLQYCDSTLNKFNLQKKWYFPNGSIVNYRVSKNYFSDNNNLKEQYSICEKPITINYVKRFCFSDLDEELFKKLMQGEMNIFDVIKENNIINEQKVKSI